MILILVDSRYSCWHLMTLYFIYRYEGLGVKEILAYLDDNHRHVFKYLPDSKIELPKTPK